MVKREISFNFNILFDNSNDFSVSIKLIYNHSPFLFFLYPLLKMTSQRRELTPYPASSPPK